MEFGFHSTQRASWQVYLLPIFYNHLLIRYNYFINLILIFYGLFLLIRGILIEIWFCFGVIYRYCEQAHWLDEAFSFLDAPRLTANHPIMTTIECWTSHECLLLPYAQALCREDLTSGLNYDCSSHMLLVGEWTRQLDGAHVVFLRRTIQVQFVHI